MTTRRGRRRPAYAMVLVVMFLVLFLGLWGQAARQIGSMIRIEEARARRVRADAANLAAEAALARALTVLEQGFPPSDPYTCAVASADGTFAATYSRDGDAWDVVVAPTADDSLPPLDASRFNAAPPP